MLMGTFMMDIGKMIKLMGMVSTVILMGLDMKVTGKRINSMVRV
jgi:hypothetical protein